MIDLKGFRCCGYLLLSKQVTTCSLPRVPQSRGPVPTSPDIRIARNGRKARRSPIIARWGRAQGCFLHCAAAQKRGQAIVRSGTTPTFNIRQVIIIVTGLRFRCFYLIAIFSVLTERKRTPTQHVIIYERPLLMTHTQKYFTQHGPYLVSKHEPCFEDEQHPVLGQAQVSGHSQPNTQPKTP